MKYANVFKIEFDFPEQKSVARIHLRAQRAPLGFFQGMGEMEVRSRARHLLRTLLTCQRGIKGWLCVHWVWWVCKGGDFSGGCGQLTALRSGARCCRCVAHPLGRVSKQAAIHSTDQQSRGMSTDAHLARG